MSVRVVCQWRNQRQLEVGDGSVVHLEVRRRTRPAISGFGVLGRDVEIPVLIREVKDSYPPSGYPDQENVKLAAYRHIVLLTTDPSISVPTLQDSAALTRTTYSGALEVGEDLMIITVGDKVEVHRFTSPSR